MFLPRPCAPFSRLEFPGDSLTVDTLGKVLVLHTGIPEVLPLFNEFCIGRTLVEGIYNFTADWDLDTGIFNLNKSWIAISDLTGSKVDFFLFTHTPTNLGCTVDSSGTITQLVLYPGNGQIYHGQIVYADLTIDSNSNLIPDFLEENTTGSLTKFLQTYSVSDPMNYINPYNMQPVGIEWDTSSNSPTLTRIDVNGDALNTDAAFFNNHMIWGGMRRCVRNRTTGVITHGSDNVGTGLTLDGSAGDVLVQIPNAKFRYEVDGTKRRWWVAPLSYNNQNFTIHPAAVQRGGATRSKLYLGAFESYGYLDGSAFKLGSATGKTPVTGEVAYPDLPNTGRLTLDDAELYVKNAGYSGIGNVWTYSYIQLLMYIEYGTFDIQTALGKGIVDLASGTNFAGKLTGADSIDTRLGTNGTGTGSGINGQTPVCWRGLENPYGNCWEFITGINMFLSDGSYRVLKRDGTGTPAATLAEGSYETGSGTVPKTADGYINGIQSGELGALSFVPSANAGSSSTYLCDQFYYPRYNPSIVLFSGIWSSGSAAGPGYRIASCAPSFSSRAIGARLELLL
jgi:hypothetical protein